MPIIPALASKVVRGWRIVPQFGSQFSTALQDIILTKKCAKRILDLSQHKKTDLRLRLSVEGGGCSGFQYNFELEPLNEGEQDPSDLIFERSGASLVVDEGSLEFVRGSTIDFVEEMIRSSFVVTNNPLSESACGMFALLWLF